MRFASHWPSSNLSLVIGFNHIGFNHIGFNHVGLNHKAETAAVVYNEAYERNYSLPFSISDYFAGMACMARCYQQQKQRYVESIRRQTPRHAG